MAERSKAPDSKNFPMSLLYSNVCVGSNTTPVEFCVQKPTFCSKQFLWESNEEQDEEEFTLQEIVIAIRLKQLRYRFLKAGWPSGLRRQTHGESIIRLWHKRVPGFESLSCQNLRSKSQPFVRSSICENQRRSSESDFTIREVLIENRLKKLWYTIFEGRMAERSKAPDSSEIQFETSGTKTCAWVRIPFLSIIVFIKPIFKRK